MIKLLQLCILTAALFLACEQTKATAQYPDKLIYNGKKYRLHTNPLEQYFRKHPGKRPKSGIISSALWRGYVATFEIIDSTLFLRDIEIEVFDDQNRESWRSVLSEVFPDKNAVSLNWFSGFLIAPYGELLQYVHADYRSTFENYLVLEIRSGQFSQSRNLKHAEYVIFLERQFELFRRTSKYKADADSVKKKLNLSGERADEFIKRHEIEYVTSILEE